MAQQTPNTDERQAIIDEFRKPWVEEYTEKHPKSKQLFEDPRTQFSARTYRDFARGAPFPYYIEGAQGFTIRDVDGNEMIDFGNNATALIHGHAHPYIEQAIIGVLRTGTSYSGSHVYRDRLAEMIAERVPGVDKVTFAMSGTEATMYAVRIARAYSGKDKVLWFGGGYHGSYDPIHAGPTFRGYPKSVEQDYLMADFNDKDGTERIIAEHKDELAAVIIEPVQGTAGYIAPRDGFLQFLRDVTLKYGVLLIFDEVITGFR
jgi:glutamate-1-semialdehyde 2,1-aminomutase